MLGAVYDPSELTALVADQNHFARHITLEQLRLMGFGRVTGASSSEEAWMLLLQHNPDVVLLEWTDDGDGLDLVRRIRTSELAPNRAVSLFMLSARGAQRDVEAARQAGVDGYLRKPISGLALQRRVKKIVTRPQPFVDTATYSGPCRRRRQDPAYQGPWRRLDDAAPGPGGPEEEVDVKVQLTRARVAALQGAVGHMLSGDPQAVRDVYQALNELIAVAEEIGDQCLALGGREMARYIKAQGALGQFNTDVLQTHVSALHQLAYLPTALGAERQQVAQSLRRMIDKKLRQASAQQR